MQARTTSARFDSSAQRKRSPDWPSSSPRGAGRGADQLAYLSAPIKAAPSSPDAALGSQKKKQERPQKEEKKKLERHPGRSAHGTRVEHVEVRHSCACQVRSPAADRRSLCVKSARAKLLRARRRPLPSSFSSFLPSYLPPTFLGRLFQAPPCPPPRAGRLVSFPLPVPLSCGPLRPKARGHP